LEKIKEARLVIRRQGVSFDLVSFVTERPPSYLVARRSLNTGPVIKTKDERNAEHGKNIKSAGKLEQTLTKRLFTGF
jgi:hypothetical protein